MTTKRTGGLTRQVKSGRPQDPVWVHFIQTPLTTASHFAAECHYCNQKWARGRPQDLQIHLAKDCSKVDNEIRRVFIRNILQLYGEEEDTESNKRPRLEQLSIMDFMDKDKHDFPKRILKACNKVVKFFKKSHQGKALLEKYTKEFNIEGGGLKTWVETRWTTMFDSVNSIWRLRSALEKVVNEHGSIVTNKTVTKIITARGFFHDTNLVLKVLEPLKKAILSVEASNTNYADCFIALVRLADAIKKILIERGLISFRTHTINSINEQWNSFDIMPLILTYFLHPGYRSTCLIMNKYTYSLANKVHLYFILGVGLKLEKQGTYATPFTKTYRITPHTWWMSCEDMPPFVKNLALKMFAVTPHSASCERMFSALDYFDSAILENDMFEEEEEDLQKFRHIYFQYFYIT
ncbi:hypothetical protein RhiirA4_428387 [Rhizophagus irregularis]|uniref:BED-type domain-containing protein n=1 Tax=Rhizophagus irregularis TaxID=588596 RepID=A0A2I1HCL2_9GLOM|nr:hypothetical protein RhiirA4_428387 [Rhizophagus irregularis]